MLSGTIGPEPARQWKVEKGLVDGAKVTFQVQQPDGPLRSFTLTLAKGRLQGTQKLERDGKTLGEVTVDAERANATYGNGIVTVTLPKSSRSRRRRRHGSSVCFVNALGR